MFIPDMPNVPPQDVPVIIAQAEQAQQSMASNERKMGVCKPIANLPGVAPHVGNTFDPSVQAGIYSYLYEHQEIDRSAYATATVSVLQNPKHGVMRLVTEADHLGVGIFDKSVQGYAYFPEKGYLGNDSATFLVDIGGKSIKLVYFFRVVDHPVGNDGDMEICKKGPYWKISSTLDTNGTSTITSVEYQSPVASVADTALTDAAALASTLGLNFAAGANVLGNSTVDPSSVTLNLAPLPGGAIGQTTGNAITLDPSAAGHGWFIDTTPTDNSEYLPTSNPNEWVAKVGTAAYGKMDMLSVLLHEYGHALGIDHSADNHDYMATTLTPGVRRMPGAEEMALMQQLVAQAKGEGACPCRFRSAQASA